GPVRWSRTPRVRMLSSLGVDDPLSRGQARYPRARRGRGARSRASAGSPRARRKSPRGSEGVRTGRTAYVGRVLGFFESFPFFQIRRRLQAFVGLVAQHSFVFRAVLVP